MRRLAIVIAVLACIGGYTAWWMSWRGDPRFVGRWVVLRGDGQPPSTLIEFGSDGSGAMYNNRLPRTTPGPALRVSWWIEDGRFIIKHQQRETGFKRLLVLFEDGYQLLIGEPAQRPILEYQTEQLAPDRWRLRGISETARNEKIEIVRESETPE